LILVTPRILKSSDDTDEVYKNALREAERWDYFKKKYGDESDDSGDSDDAVGATSDAGAAGQG
jgi:uncharacterized protein YeaO (DUF488 family)